MQHNRQTILEELESKRAIANAVREAQWESFKASESLTDKLRSDWCESLREVESLDRQIAVERAIEERQAVSA